MQPIQPGGAPLAASAAGDSARFSWPVVVLSLATLSAALGTSIANVALPGIAGRLEAPFGAVQWIVIAYLLASTVALVAVGRLGDLFGARRLLLAGLALFALASLAGAAAPSLGLLLGARTLQGAAAAVLIALSLALVRSTVSRERTGSAMGLVGTMSALGTALGPSLGGVLVDSLGWRSVFLATAVPAGLALAIGLRHLLADRPARAAARERFDLRGAALLAATLASLALALTLGRNGHGAWIAGAGFVASLGGAAFVQVERRSAAPLVPMDLLRWRRHGAALAASGGVSAVMMATLVVGPFHLTRGLGLDATHAGLVMAVGPLVSALAGIPAGRLVDAVGARRTTLAGLVAVLLGAAGLAALGGRTNLLGYALPLAAMTGGYALFQVANNTSVMAGADEGRRGLLSGLLGLSRNLGLMVGATAFGALFAASWGAGALADATSQQVIDGMRSTFACAAALVAVLLAGLGTLRASRLP